MTWQEIALLIIGCVILALAATTAFAYLTLFERRLLARFQHRIGPNRAGPFGIFQPLADALKLFFKEDVVPLKADKWVYIAAPAFAMIPALIIWATIPFGCWPIGPNARLGCPPGSGNLLQLADVNIGVLYLLAITSLGVYGIAIAGWASNNKYSMLGGVRASAQVISYELALGLAILGAVMQAGTFSTSGIVYAQRDVWFILPQFLGFVLFLITSTAEVVRAPFDLVEAEQELVGGYNTEYGSMKFALFFMSEYIKLIAMSAIGVMLYLGGWRFPGLETLAAWVTANVGAVYGNAVYGLLSLGAFLLKIVVFLFLSVWIRATLPRVRYDQLMDLGWKVLLPLALFNVAVTAVLNVAFPDQTVFVSAGGLIIGLLTVVIAAALDRSRERRDRVVLVKKGTT
jgi:NADH-quinone oxidoreductase subunit H